MYNENGLPYTFTHAYQQECMSRCGALARPVIMASPAHHCCAKNLTEDEPFGSSESSASIKIPQLPEKEYDFVEEPSQDYICPVTLELLRDPQQTTCCGHHLSLEAATRLQQGGKPCPMCNESNLTTMPDKFYKRKVNELKVRCPNNGSGCEWVGDLGSLGQHANSCPKRPWQCDFCDFKGTYEVVTNDHFPVCVKYPEPCPNQCEMVTVPRCGVPVRMWWWLWHHHRIT